MKHYVPRIKFIPGSLWFSILLVGSVFLNSCVTTKKTSYLQEFRQSEYSTEFVPPVEYKIQPNDNLYVRVSTPDPNLSAIFNPMPGGVTTTRVEESTANLLSYPVKLDGTVDLPYIGAVEVAGKTLSEARSAVEASLIDYVTDASVTVRLVNNYVSILGEVNSPGMYPIYKERLNIFQALAMAGDMAEISNRRELSIIRQTPEGSIIKQFDLTDKNIVDSEFYYVMPNDIIYAKPIKGSLFRRNQPTITLITTTISTISTAIALFLVIQNQLILQNPQ
ncbi:MAG: polysaccharide biosynthesis/export family protein [Bacteroidales bacterium]|nr:polysaccharide biosynthesis/export family protein [Bacteroidales bacterium]